MKLFPRLLAPAAALLSLGAAAPLGAQSITENHFQAVNLTIADNSIIGASSTQTFGPGIGDTAVFSITQVTVTLNITGGFNGDYYAYLQHTDPSGNSTIAILLNRSGRTSTNLDGYLDAGLSNVVFSDAAANGDIHLYQSVVNPSGAALTGTWQPDARAVNPATATDAATRSAFLSAFTGADAHGAWTLFVADFAAGGQGIFVDWNLTITGVPEPGTVAVGALLLGALAWHQRRRFARQGPPKS